MQAGLKYATAVTGELTLIQRFAQVVLSLGRASHRGSN